MDCSADSSIDTLAASTTIKDYGNISIVTIPNCATLSASERTAVFMKAQQRQMATPLFTDTLMSRLRSVTPPLDEEEENEESRALEAKARKELENEGCSPCYPPDLDIPLQNPPEKYQAIIRYWKSFPGTEDVVLCAQLSGWQEFRASQTRTRRHYRTRLFSELIDEISERRRRHKVGGEVRLLLDPKQQSRLENWMEFQNYHLKRFEQFEKKWDDLRKELDDAVKKVEDTDTAGYERAAEDVEIIQQILKNAERDLERHKVLLEWIEQERQAMNPGYLTPVEDNNDQDIASKAVRRTSPRNHQKKRPETSTVLGKARVTKAKPKKRKMQTQQLEAPAIKPTVQNSNAIKPSSIPQAPKRQRTKKETPLRQLHPQRVSKAKSFAGTGAEPLSRTQCRSARQMRSLDRRLSLG